MVCDLALDGDTVMAARTDLVDVSNHNGKMTVSNFTQMRNEYGVKAMCCKISEGTYYINPTAEIDIKAAQQAGLSCTENDACIQTMKQVVENTGYRFSVYSMSSWGDNHIPWKDIKWIANYPYHVTNDRYTKGSAWQWTDNYPFNGSYDAFDNYMIIFSLAVKIRMRLLVTIKLRM